MISLTLNDISNFLRKEKFNPSFDDTHSQLQMQVNIESVEYPFFIRILSENLLQMLFFLPLPKINEEKDEVGRLLHWINHQIDLPGFCLNEENGVLFYRLVLPLSKSSLDTQLFLSLFATSREIIRVFTPLIATLLSKNISLEEIFKSFQEQGT